MDEITVKDITLSGPVEDLGSYDPPELPEGAKRIFAEILGGFV